MYYPCSGSDLLVPVELFAPFGTDFWFADRGYFAPGHQDTEDLGLDVPADKLGPVLAANTDYKLIDTTIIGPVAGDRYARDIDPCVLTQTYEHIPSKKQIRINLRRGYALSAFQKEIHTLGVFFYRGDSMGEGGSGH